MFDPFTALAALAPLVVEGGKAAIQRWLAPETFKPTNIDDYVKIKELDLNLFKAINDAGGTNPTYLWVEAVVRLMRPFAAAIVLGTWGTMQLAGLPVSDAVTNFAACIGFYLFGDRSLFYARNNIK